MSEIKRCPFCGGNPRTEVFVQQKGGGEDHIDFTVRCIECGTAKTARLKINGYCSYIDVDNAMREAVATWNRRVSDESIH